MNDRLKEQLIGYALGALDENEQREIEQRLSGDAELRRELEAVQSALEPLADAYEEHQPPAGLTERACAYVADESQRLNQLQPGSSATNGGFEARARWELSDWVVMSGICAAAVLLFFPAILNSRFMARVTACQQNLRNIGMSLGQFSDYVGHGYFPQAALAGNRAFAGVYAPSLYDCGLLKNVRDVICPESELAEPHCQFRMPTLWEIDTAQGHQILILQRIAGGSYAYNLGVIINGRLQPIRNLGRPTFALMADAPRNSWDASMHGHGRNILYEDQHIAFVTDGPRAEMIDDPFCNRFGRLEAGVDVEDAVVGQSDCPPTRNLLMISP